MNFVVDFNEDANEDCSPEKKFPPTYEEYCRKRGVGGAPIDINKHFENASKEAEIYKQEVLEGRRENKATLGEAIGVPFYDKAYHQCTTPLSKDYFDYQTVQFIRYYISAIFLEKYGIPLGLQPYNPVYLFMVQMYNDLACDMCQNRGKGSNAFNILLSYTLQQLEKRIYNNFSQQVGMLNWTQAATNSIQIEYPQYTRVNRKELQMSRYYNGCWGQK